MSLAEQVAALESEVASLRAQIATRPPPRKPPEVTVEARGINWSTYLCGVEIWSDDLKPVAEAVAQRIRRGLAAWEAHWPPAPGACEGCKDITRRCGEAVVAAIDATVRRERKRAETDFETTVAAHVEATRKHNEERIRLTRERDEARADAASRGFRTPERCSLHGFFEGQPVEGVYRATCPHCERETADRDRAVAEAVAKEREAEEASNEGFLCDADGCAEPARFTVQQLRIEVAVAYARGRREALEEAAKASSQGDAPIDPGTTSTDAKCSRCGGQGWMREQDIVGEWKAPKCPDCKGTGKAPEAKREYGVRRNCVPGEKPAEPAGEESTEVSVVDCQRSNTVYVEYAGIRIATFSGASINEDADECADALRRIVAEAYARGRREATHKAVVYAVAKTVEWMNGECPEKAETIVEYGDRLIRELGEAGK